MNRPGEYDTCLQLIGFQPSLEIYQETNTGKKPYEYKQCGKPPVCSGSFGTGRVAHSVGKCYACDQCGKSLCSSSSLQKA